MSMFATKNAALCTCMKRFSKDRPVTTDVPLAIVFMAMKLRMHAVGKTEVGGGAKTH